MKKLKNSGFTLVEIAIVMVIIGLLLGGALKGQQMIENARYKAFKSELNELRAAVFSFRDIYGSFPGDIKKEKLEKLLPDAIASTGSSLGNGKIYGGYCDDNGEESCYVFHHLRVAGLISGDPNTSGKASQFETPAGGRYDTISTGNWGNGIDELKILTRDVSGEVGQRLDSELDDGNGKTGSISCYSGCDWDKTKLQNIFITL